jgi:hypothetical protein
LLRCAGNHSVLSFRSRRFSNLDAELIRLRKRGLSFGQISERMGITRSAAIGRFNRLIGNVFPSDAARQREEAADVRRRAAERLEKQRHLTKKLKADIAAGKNRDRAIKEAYEAGATVRASDFSLQNNYPLGRRRIGCRIACRFEFGNARL